MNTQLKSQYDIDAEALLADLGVEFTATFKRHGKYFDDDTDTRDVYRCTLKRGRLEYSFQFGQSIAKSCPYHKLQPNRCYDGHFKAGKKRIKPTAYDILTCLQKYNPETFEDFCSEYGYDTDSRKAEKTWRAVVDEWLQVSRMFTEAELERLQEIN